MSGERSAEGRIEVRAPVERVWRALTEASELERWFPLESRVESPGEGGRIYMSWGGEYAGWSEIEAWDAPRHLRTSWGWSEGEAQVTDYWLEGDGETTRVRVVTSGFPADATWDDLVEGTRLGWLFELRQLKHYLERHADEDRRAAYIRRRVSLERSEAWRRLTDGLDVDHLAAEVVDRSPPWQLAAVAGEPADGLIRLTIDPTHHDPSLRDVTVWLCAWGDARAGVEEAAAHWRAELARLFPEGEALEAEG
jgi:uncharacterized protein YndB with AHSA1/START domain